MVGICNNERINIPVITKVDVSIRNNKVDLYFNNGEILHFTLAQANERIKVNGRPVIDWYAEKN